MPLYIHNRVPPPPLAAEAESKLELYALENGMQFVLDLPTAASATSPNTEPFNLSNGDTLKVIIDDRSEQTIALANLTPSAATAAQVATSLSLQLKGARLSAGSSVTIESLALGQDSIVQVTGGSAMAILGFSDAVHTGSQNTETIVFNSGDFVDIGAASATEVNDVFAANLVNATSRLTIDGDRVRLSTTYPQLTCSGQGAKALGMMSSASVDSGNAETFALEAEQTLLISVDGGQSQTITFYPESFYDISVATAEEVAEAINSQLTGGSATSTATIVSIATSTQTLPNSIQVTGGTANTALGFPTAIQYGAGIGTQVLAQAYEADPISFELLDSGTSGFDDCQVYVTTGFIRELVYDSNGPVLATGWSVTDLLSTSPGAITPDIWSISLAHTTPFVSSERVTVEIEAATLAPETASATYIFEAEDTRRPQVEEVKHVDRRTLRLRFSEPMNQSADATDMTSALSTKDVSGRISYHSTLTIGVSSYTNVVQGPSGAFSSDHVGLFLGSAGAQNAKNNGIFTIIDYLNDAMVRVDHVLTDEEPADLTQVEGPTVVVSPYRLSPVFPADPQIQPAFTPIVLSVQAVPQTAIPSYEDVERYVFVNLHDEPTPNIVYDLELVRIADAAGNEIVSPFTYNSWQLQSPEGRSFDLWENTIPEYNKDQDDTRDLERLVRCIDEAAKVMLDDVDRFGWLFDPYLVPDHLLDTVLGHLGNPFAFAAGLTPDRKRDLITVLVRIYKLKGTDLCLEQAISFFLGKSASVVPWDIPTDTWTLGESELGYDTNLGPSRSFVRYSFFLEHADSLSNTEKDIIRQIVDFAKPAHTHFIGFMQT